MHYVAIGRNTLVEDIEAGCNLSLRSYVNGHPGYILFCRGDEQFRCDREGALIESAGILRETFRTSDIIARIGGDGFEVVSIETPRESIHG
jgi:hypothetical protein